MRRIENFKVPIYHYDIIRKTKKNGLNAVSLFGEGDNFEKNFKEFISNSISKTKLSAIYLNLSVAEFMETVKTREFDPTDKSMKINTITLSCLTLSKDVEEYINGQNEEEKKISETALEVYAKTAINALTDMIAEEAKKENSELSLPYFIYSPFNFENFIVLDSDFSSYLAKLQSEKIGIKSENGVVVPKYSALFFVYWSLKKKK